MKKHVTRCVVLWLDFLCRRGTPKAALTQQDVRRLNSLLNDITRQSLCETRKRGASRVFAEGTGNYRVPPVVFDVPEPLPPDPPRDLGLRAFLWSLALGFFVGFITQR